MTMAVSFQPFKNRIIIVKIPNSSGEYLKKKMGGCMS
jgi:hypothetical protein